MKNTLLKFDKEEVEIPWGNSQTVFVSNYFSKNIRISEIFIEVKDMVDIYQMVDDDKLERISYEIYGTTDYWDILLLLNDRNPLFEMPYNDDVLSESSEDAVELYTDFIYSHAPLIQRRVDELKAEFLEQAKEDKESYRFLYVIKPSRINDFISLIKNKGYI